MRKQNLAPHIQVEEKKKEKKILPKLNLEPLLTTQTVEKTPIVVCEKQIKVSNTTQSNDFMLLDDTTSNSLSSDNSTSFKNSMSTMVESSTSLASSSTVIVEKEESAVCPICLGKQRLAAAISHIFLTFLFVYCDATA
jgi:hypothetical protein